MIELPLERVDGQAAPSHSSGPRALKDVVYINATDELGGADSSLYELVRCLDRTVFRPHVVLPDDRVWGKRYADLGVAVHVVPLKKLKNTCDPRWHIEYLSRAPARVRGILRVLRAIEPSIVHMNTSVELLAGLAARRHCDLTGARLVWHVRELDLRPAWMERVVFATVARWADAIIAISTPLARRFAGSGRVHLVPNGVDLDRFSPRPVQDDASFDRELAEGPRLGWVGRVVPVKGLENVLQVFARVREHTPAARLLVAGSVVAGHEAYAARLRDTALRSVSGAAIEWRVSTHEPESVYAQIDLFVHLPEFQEPLGRTAIEAQASGVPVLTWPRGGLGETLEDRRTGRLVRVGDLDGAVAATLEMLADPPGLRAMSRAAGAFARERFSAHRCVDRVEAIYAELLRA